MRRLALLLVTVGLLLSACKKDETPAPAATPAAGPAEGAVAAAPQAAPPAKAAPTPPPVTATFVRLDQAEGAERAVLRFANTSDQGIQRLLLSLTFFSADGRELGRHPWAQSSDEVVPAKGQAELALGATLATGTARVEAQVLEARFKDGQTWRASGARILGTRSNRPASFKLNNVEHLRAVTRGDAQVKDAPRPPARSAAPNVNPAPISAQPPITR